MHEDIVRFGSGVAGATAEVELGPAGALSHLVSSLIVLRARRKEHSAQCFKILISLVACLILRLCKGSSIRNLFIYNASDGDRD
jgi:hypothetical protein